MYEVFVRYTHKPDREVRYLTEEEGITDAYYLGYKTLIRFEVYASYVIDLNPRHIISIRQNEVKNENS